MWRPHHSPRRGLGHYSFNVGNEEQSAHMCLEAPESIIHIEFENEKEP